jgi:uncharacterized protein
MNSLEKVTMLNSVLYIGLGLLTGVLSGIFGIGGGIILIPALVFFFGFTQHTAQGTTMALLVLPIGFFAALEYFRNGHVDIRVGALIALGFVIGGFLGAKVANGLSEVVLARVFGVGLVLIGIRMIIS